MSTAGLADPLLCPELPPACAVPVSKTDVADIVVRWRVRQRARLIVETAFIASLGILLPTATLCFAGGVKNWQDHPELVSILVGVWALAGASGFIGSALYVRDVWIQKGMQTREARKPFLAVLFGSSIFTIVTLLPWAGQQDSRRVGFSIVVSAAIAGLGARFSRILDRER